MQPQIWTQYATRIYQVLNALLFTNEKGTMLNSDAAFTHWTELTSELGRKRGAVYMIGNGASASMASHFAADLAKNARLHTEVFSDLSLITAISNDLSYDQVFAEPLRRRGQSGDMLVAISSSGRSPNIIAAAEVANELKMTLVTLSAMKPDNPLRQMGQLNLYVPGDTYGLAESAHAVALHWWMDLVQIARNS